MLGIDGVDKPSRSQARRSLHTSRAVAEWLIAERQQPLRYLAEVLEVASITREVAGA